MDNIFIFGLIVVLTMAIQLMAAYVRNKVINFIIFIICVGGMGSYLYLSNPLSSQTYSKDDGFIFALEFAVFLLFTIIYLAAFSVKCSENSTK